MTNDQTKPVIKKYKFQYSSNMIPHPEKQAKGGEDAIITKDNLLVVADGVGGWAQLGVDSGLYSKNLCKIISDLFDGDQDYYINRPDKLLKLAVRSNTVIGSSTITILTLNQDTGKLRIAYLGDSLTSVYSQGQLFKTVQLTHDFNLPYQASKQCRDLDLVKKQQQNLQEGDLIITASDGIWDNLYDRQIQYIIRKSYDVKSLANNLSTQAFKYSEDKNFNSPFAMKASQHKINYVGGKPDDISVIAAKVIKI